MKRSTTIILLLVLHLTTFAQEWKLAKEKDGIKVYTRQKEGSKIKEFKATAVFQGTPEKYAVEIRDVKAHKEWITDMEASEKLKDMGTSGYSYFVLDMPWPANDRDMVIFSEEDKMDNGIKFTMSSAYDFKDENEDAIRIRELSGYWLFKQLGNNKVAITYSFFADPAGNLPTWIINMFIVDGPLQTLKNLKDRIL